MGHPAYIYQESARYEYQLLHGKKCRLRDIDWSNDYHFLRGLFDEKGIAASFAIDGGVFNSPERIHAWIYTGKTKSIDSWAWIVEDLEGNRIGLAYLQNVNHKHRSAGPWLIWIHKDARGNNIGIDVEHVIFRFGFDYLNLHKIWTSILTSNVVSLEQDDKYDSWHHNEGIQKDVILFNGNWISLRRSAVFEEDEEWKSYWM